MKGLIRTGLAVLLALAASGCATVPYRYGHDIETENIPELQPGEPQFVRGRPNAVIDALGWILGIPAKIILLDRRMDNHQISEATEDALREYLHSNDLHRVKVRVNQYAPGGEWSRLFRNKSVGAGWRYTIGLISTLFYTILPGRLFGGDNYNPYTNTINLYSDHPAVAVHEGGHAKDFAPRKWKGTYGFAYMLPFVALYAEARASNDAMSYLHAQPEALGEEEGYEILYPAYATYIGGETMQMVGAYPVIYVAAVIPGHIIGKWKAAHVERRRAREYLVEESPPEE